MGLNEHLAHANVIGDYLQFLLEAESRLKRPVSKDSAEVKRIRAPLEEHYQDDRGQAAMYQRFESALYDDAPALVTLWQFMDEFTPEELTVYRRLTQLELEGLSGDRHPRKVFDRSPFGIVALIIGTVTIWMTVLRTYSGDDFLSELLAAVRFNSIVGTIWVVGLFVVVWFILKTHRNNRQVAFLSSVSRSLNLYLDRYETETSASIKPLPAELPQSRRA
ncbi:MAG: hypothetical protein ACR2NZ_18210 [Rubripirellula sp.]